MSCPVPPAQQELERWILYTNHRRLERLTRALDKGERLALIVRLELEERGAEVLAYCRDSACLPSSP